MTRLSDKRVLLGVGGGIAAYKAPELVREFTKAGADVRVVLTRSAQEFVSKLTLEALSGNRVGVDLFEPGFEHEIGHIEMARWADVLVLAPATANLLARMRAGLADDLLTTLVLATRAPVVAFPAMNTQMWLHAAVQENISVLRSRGVTVVDPDVGVLACKEVGPGRQPDPGVILACAERALHGVRLRGRRVVVTAGPTREYFDPVRFLSNPSSGRMGYALAEAAFAQGADVTLISGPVALEAPGGVRLVRTTSALEMRDAVLAAADCDALLMSAAVADWRPAMRDESKRKKTDRAWAPEFARTPDILAELAGHKRRPKVVVGFAAETENVLENAREKLTRKRLDGIVANDVSGGRAFGSADNHVFLVESGAEPVSVGPGPKRVIGDAIVAWLANLLEART